jgi:outer membrane protein TolC
VRVAPPLALLLTILTAAGSDLGAQQQQPPPPAPSPAPTPARPMPAVTSATFLGGVPSGAPTEGVITIGILDAMNRALEHNLGVLTADEQLGRAQGTRWKELAALLPNVNGRVSETRQEINLQAFGFGAFGAAFAGVPTIVGPFNVFDARVYVSQAVVDLGALNTTRSEGHNVAAARYTYQGARDFVVWVAGDLYLQALAAAARVESARAQQETAQTLYDQAVDLRQNGIVAGIDVLRAEVQLNVEKNRTTSAANDAEKAKLQLARVMGLPLGQQFALDPTLPDLPTPDLSLDQAIERAYQTRADYQAALERVRAAEASRAAIIGEALPAVRVNADFGDIGLSPTDSHGTFSVTGALQIPIFQGGRMHGRLMEADADLRARRSEAEDLKGSIYYDVRTAYLDLQSTMDQLDVATKARDLASQQLTQSRDRFLAGVASNIEIIQAQESVAVANEQYISALYGYDLAKGALIRGVGTAESTLRQFLGGTR